MSREKFSFTKFGFAFFLIAASLIFVSCFDATHNISYDKKSKSYICHTELLFNKTALALLDISSEDFKEEIGEYGDGDDASITEDDENIYLTAVESFKKKEQKIFTFKKNAVIVNLNELLPIQDMKQSFVEGFQELKDELNNSDNDDYDEDYENITEGLKEILRDAEVQDYINLLFGKSQWNIQIDKSIKNEVSKAQFVDFNGNGFEVSVKDRVTYYEFSIPFAKVLQSDFDIQSLVLY